MILRSLLLFVEDVKRAFANLPKHSSSSGGYCADKLLKLRGWDGKGKPEITDSVISFNGAGEMSHETMFIEREIVFDLNENWDKYRAENFAKKGECFAFCKTARKPYDLAVQIVLILYKHHFSKVVEVSSDGDEADWAEAFKFTDKHFGINGSMGKRLALFEGVLDEVVI